MRIKNRKIDSFGLFSVTAAHLALTEVVLVRIQREVIMFYISKNSKFKTVVDSQNRVVGFISNNRFMQKTNSSEFRCDSIYETGLSAIELEQVSEAIQNNRQYKVCKK